MGKNWKAAPAVQADDDISDLPDPVATEQYSKPIGPTTEGKVQAKEQYSKPIGPHQESIFQRATRALNPSAPEKATAAGRNAGKNLKQKGINTLQNLGRNVGAAAVKMNVAPAWLPGAHQKKQSGKGKAQAAGGVPDWVMGRGTPWGQQSQQQGDHGDVVRVVVTKTHADGTVTRSYRKPRQKKQGFDPLNMRMPY